MPASNEHTIAAEKLLDEAAELLADGGTIGREKARTCALIAIGYALIGSANIYFDAPPRESS
jgi:hypothetical protein